MLELITKIIQQFERKNQEVQLGNWLSNLHYHGTVWILLICCGLVSSHQYFGQPLQCILDVSGDDSAVPENVLNSFCFITSTYTVIRRQDDGDLTAWKNEPTTRRHSYYQWVPIVLFIQSVLFRGPHQLWKYVDNGLLSGCLREITGDLVDAEKLRSRACLLAEYIYQRIGTFKVWSLWLIFAEILSLCVAVFNFWFTNYILGGNFLHLGFQLLSTVLKWKPGGGSSLATFPKLTKCDFYKYGPSGTIQRLDALCIMTLNIINEKIFAFLWFWFLTMCCLSALHLLFRIFSLTLMFWKPKGSLLRNIFPLEGTSFDSEAAINRLGVTDWVFLAQVKLNLKREQYQMLFPSLTRIIANNSWSDSNSNLIV